MRWQVDKAGYGLAVRRRRALKASTCIKPLSFDFEPYEVGILERSIFIDLAEADATPEGALAFTNKWGSLTESVFDLNVFYVGRLEIRNAIEAGKRGATALVRHLQAPPMADFMDGGKYYPFKDGVGSLNTNFDWRRHGKKFSQPALFFEANDLLQFCMLEVVHTVMGGMKISKCGVCGTYLHIPQNGRPPLYCKDACKQQAYRRRLKSGRNNEMAAKRPRPSGKRKNPSNGAAVKGC